MRAGRFFAFLFIVFVVGGALPACGNSRPEDESPLPDSASHPGASASPLSVDDDAPDAPPAVIQSITATGKTSTDVKVALRIDIADSKITGTMTADSRVFEVHGMLDGDTVRCWLRSSGDDSYRGHLIATRRDATLAGTFVVSSNAGENVIQGAISD